MSHASSVKSSFWPSASSQEKKMSRFVERVSIKVNCSSAFGSDLTSARRGASVALLPSMRKVSRRACHRFAASQ
jgi:hypothetical protein